MNDNPIADYVRQREFIELPNGEPMVANTYKEYFLEAERQGIQGLETAFKKLMKKYSRVMVELTAIHIIINWLSWDRYEQGYSDFARWYTDKYNELRLQILNDKTWSKEEITYYIRTTD